MCKRAVILVMVWAVVLSASSTFAQEFKEKKQHGREHIMKGKMDKVQARVDELTAELQLKPEQGAKIKEILTRSHNEAKVILEEAKAKVKEIRVKEHEEIKSLLTEEQRKKFQQIRQKHEAAPKISEE